MPGILNFSRYLETLQAVTELGNIFPSTQKTLTYYVGSPGTTQGWTATIQWMTLIIDQYQESASGVPDFTNSRVYGYYAGGSTTQYSTGTISIPANMYTGPLLPASLTDLPISVVNISWLRGQETYDVNLAFKQNWEPGVTIGNPMSGIDYEPIDPLASTLTLTGPAVALTGQTATFVATSDIPISLGSPNPAYLYANSTLVATSIMVDHTATFNILLGVGTYTMISQFGGIGDYGTVFSNTLTYTVQEYIPLIVNSQNLTPAKDRYFPGEQVTYTVNVIPDPSYTPSGEQVTTTSRVSVINQEPPSTSTQVYNDRFYSGQLTATFTITSVMVDSDLSWSGTAYGISSWTTSTSQYTATILITNTNSLVVDWDNQIQGRYSSGSYSRNLVVSSTQTVTRSITPFPLTLSISTSRAIVSSPLQFTVGTTSSAYGNQISIYGIEQTTATLLTLYSTNTSLQTGFTATIALPYAGTWTLYAGYPGDFGQSIAYANAASQSNSVNHLSTLGYDIPLTFEFFRTLSNDILRVTANTSTTMTNAISFYNNGTFLGSATWVRLSTSSSIQVETQPIQEVWAAPPGIVYHSTSTRADLVRFGAPRYYNSVSTILIHSYYDGSNLSQNLRPTLSTSSVISVLQYDGQQPPNLRYTYRTQIKTYEFQEYKTTWEVTPTTLDIKPWFNYYGRAYNTAFSNGSYFLAFKGSGNSSYFNVLATSKLDWDYAPAMFEQTQGVAGQYSLQTSRAGTDEIWRLGRTNNLLGLSPFDNTRVQQLYNSGINGKIQGNGYSNPNVFRAWRYYDGTNYNLSTTTAFLDSLDPITTGTWTVNLIQSYNLNDTWQQKTSGNKFFATNNLFPFSAIQFADESRVYDDSLVDYGWDLYDVYRIDQVGDTRGYNVVGLNAQRMGSPPSVSSSNPKRLYFQPKYFYNWRDGRPTSGNTLYYIDLVEYIGQITVNNPIRTQAEYQGTTATTTSSVHLFRFTPEVRQTDRSYRVTTPVEDHLNALPANTYQGSGRASRIPISQLGFFKMPPNAPKWANKWCRNDLFDFRLGYGETGVDGQYGKKIWVSRDINDPVENNYTDFCNAWYNHFVESWNTLYQGQARILSQGSFGILRQRPVNGTEATYNNTAIDIDRRWDYKGWNRSQSPTTATSYFVQNSYQALGIELAPNDFKSWLANETTTTTVTTYYTTQTVTLTLSSGTFDIYKIGRAEWPGTLELGPEYGDFNPQTLILPSTGTVRLNFYEATSLTERTTITPFRSIRLRATLDQNLSGYVRFYNSTTDFTFGTSTVVNQVSDLTVNVNTFTGQIVDNTCSITVKFFENLTSREIQGQSKILTVNTLSGYSSTGFSQGAPWGPLQDQYYSGFYPSIETAPSPYQWRNAAYATAWRVNGNFTLLYPKLPGNLSSLSSYSVNIQIGLRTSYSVIDWGGSFPNLGGNYTTIKNDVIQNITQTIPLQFSQDYFTHSLTVNNFILYVPTPPNVVVQGNYKINSIGVYAIVTYLQDGTTVQGIDQTGQVYFINNLTASNPDGI